MGTPDGRVATVARAATVATTTTATSAAAHAVGGGHLTPPVLLGALGVLLLAAAVPIARRRLTAPVLLAWTGAAQLAVHLALSWLHPVAGTAVSVAAHHGVESATALTGAAPGAALPMLAAHILGTVLAVSLAVSADRSVELARSWWAGTVAVLLGIAQPGARQARAVAPAHVDRPTVRILAHAVARRGPPLPTAA
ncbi:hypothetical protein OEB99_18440 [Actinotalea sp. M2MS4P-6]|uniref:hypothetical protein n=1 Tax=Actinotalea sp. M2MS4P-6 TaxID=2983762 RepID=UPI0021E43B5B|nr:hypothetical protein [Actinotalea sp. M2MS4P-6]MCV2396294.1 hypothetical protein [Actinotalea sp. M2MS4P-6]